MDAELTKLLMFINQRLDHNPLKTEFDRGNYIAYSIAKIMIQNILFKILDKQLADSLDDGDSVY